MVNYACGRSKSHCDGGKPGSMPARIARKCSFMVWIARVGLLWQIRSDSRRFARRESVLFPSTYILAMTCLSCERKAEKMLSSKR